MDGRDVALGVVEGWLFVGGGADGGGVVAAHAMPCHAHCILAVTDNDSTDRLSIG
tara:strand:- start:4429 stop:4593 length:165 start_codon:yes stop_codon:yes gene_type:complete